MQTGWNEYRCIKTADEQIAAANVLNTDQRYIRQGRIHRHRLDFRGISAESCRTWNYKGEILYRNVAK